MQRLFLPSADGPHRTGYSKFHLVNAAHRESTRKEKCRSFDVMVWYPGEVTLKSKPVSYIEDFNSPFLSKLNALIGADNVRKFLVDEMTGSFRDVEISGKKNEYPVIIFSPDVGYFPNCYTALMEYFASRGFFVFSLCHPDVNDKVISWKTAEVMRRKICRMIVSGFRSYNLADEKVSAPVVSSADYQALLGNAFQTMLADRVEDMSFVLDYLQNTNEEEKSHTWESHRFFSSRLNLNRVIVMGHGFGGLVSHQLTSRENISAHVLLGSHSKLLSDGSLTQTKPTLIVTTDAGDKSSHVIEGLVHDSFTDFIFYKHVKAHFSVDHLLSPRITFSRIAAAITPFVVENGMSKVSAEAKAVL